MSADELTAKEHRSLILKTNEAIYLAPMVHLSIVQVHFRFKIFF